MVAVGQNAIKYFQDFESNIFGSSSAPSQKAAPQSSQQIAEAALRQVFDFFGGDNAEAAADAAIKEHEEINNNLDASLQTQAEANRNAIQPIIDQINENLDKISGILDKITDLEEEKEDANQEVKAHQKEIEIQKEAYENATTPDERKKALAAISAENVAVQELLGRVQTLSDQQTELNDMGEEYKSTNDDLNGQAIDVKADGEAKIEAINQQAVVNKTQATGKLAAEETKYTAKGAEYLAKAIAAQTSGLFGSLFSFGIGGVAGNMEYQKYMQLSEQNFSAAGIIGKGLPEILSTIGNVFDGTKTNMGYLTNTSSLVGSLTAAAEGDTNAFFGISNSLGSMLDESLKNWTDTSNNINSALEQANEDDTAASQVNADDSSRDGDTPDNSGDDEKKKFNAEVDFQVQMA